ncbi:putative Transcriptional regulator, Crp/Fnr family [Bradyrhizobium sp. ORS 285]|uniref:Crp/Fnr family transcriptional regulator n=1 Tax=Bradyrhizobium sp. ORS 285 TaxID=115808 RepID=UPI0002405BCA|nr:Crp/Fnr family transcriptional regulator [Bradyrhizobium sp. ORS 285]CCD85401.1 putative Transcriptional regulator, Crp/Fnr family [Bradyrhizobium sp. ORS 285]SMX60010.1 putative Transcriptional regulator, Crp/Fnr family [Bradyrhizobium sp. ORS 285]
MQAGFAFTKLADRLTSLLELSSDDLELLAQMPSSIRSFAPHEDVWRKGDEPSTCCLLLQGYLCWKDTDAGAGQITAIYVPGDVPDLYTIIVPRVAAQLNALSPVVAAFVPHAFLREARARSARLARALSLLTLADAATLRTWLTNLGSRDSLSRVAHLICEITVRLRAVGLGRDLRFPSPFTQSDLAAICGISPVHANRTIQDLRRRELLHWHSRTITVTDWDGLTQLAGFRPDYLMLRQPPTLESHATEQRGAGSPLESSAQS